MRAEPSLTVQTVAETGLPRGASEVLIGLRPGPDGATADPADVELLAGWGVDLPSRLQRFQVTGEVGEVVFLDLPTTNPRGVFAVGLGPGTAADLRRAAASAVRKLRGCQHVADYVAGRIEPTGLRGWVEGLVLGAGGFTMASVAGKPPLRRVTAVGVAAEGAGVVAAGLAHARASNLARRLAATPSNVKSPAWLAEQFAETRHPHLSVQVWDVTALQEAGFGGILAVGAGSARPPRFVRLDFPARSANAARRVVLVGKGITFDSGGLSLKPPESQIPMKTDMTGAAVVGAVMSALGEVCPAGLAVTALLCLAENLPGAAAARPDDVVTHFGGLTSEVRNTDAEGRLVLGDGLAYAVTKLQPDVVVDVATLTGAATLGLGRRYGALFANSDGLAAALTAAGELAGESLWRLPLYEEYRERIASDVADQANSDGEGPGPGAITAALFLSRFVGETAWAHLDIAGPARSDAERGDIPKGATGFGVRVLLRWIEAGAPA